MKEALIIVDMQNDFVLPEGKLPVPKAEEIIDNIKVLRDIACEQDILIIYTKDWHDKHDEEFSKWPPHCIEHSWGAEIIEELETGMSSKFWEEAFHKTTFSMFSNPLIVPFLRKHNITNLTFTGVATEYCVLSCISDAIIDYNYDVTLVVDAIKGVELKEGDIANALIKMGRIKVMPEYTKDVFMD